MKREPRTYIMDLSDFEEALAAGDNSPGAKHGRFLRRVVEAATVRPAGSWDPAAVRCSERPGRGNCLGGIVVRRREADERGLGGVDWICLECADHGTITGWEGGLGDLRAAAVSDLDILDMVVSWDEYELLREIDSVQEGLPRLLASAQFQYGRVFFLGTAAELMTLAGLLREEAAYRPRSRRSRTLKDIARCAEGMAAGPTDLARLLGDTSTLN